MSILFHVGQEVDLLFYYRRRRNSDRFAFVKKLGVIIPFPRGDILIHSEDLKDTSNVNYDFLYQEEYQKALGDRNLYTEDGQLYAIGDEDDNEFLYLVLLSSGEKMEYYRSELNKFIRTIAKNERMVNKTMNTFSQKKLPPGINRNIASYAFNYGGKKKTKKERKGRKRGKTRNNI